ncbi:MAG: biotin transporter BioY [Lachnospiraceae bacterium]|jgi:biotin transport system substrate-specific component|nr:biotin transporter BioY [Lachnospiraceae bacterium]
MNAIDKKTTALKQFQTKDLAQIALMAAVLCILGPISLPIGPVPISLTNLAIYFSLYLLGTKKGTISYLVYMLIGLIGLPVFSGMQGGPQKLFGVTGGYIIGFIFMALIAGLFLEKWPDKLWLHLSGMLLGTAVCYAFGTAWFLVLTDGYTILGALAVCVFPFIIGDVIKMILAMVIAPQIRRRLTGIL